MDTPTKGTIREAMGELGPSRIEAIKERTGLSDAMLYPSILAMEDDEEVVSRTEGGADPSMRIYELARRA